MRNTPALLPLMIAAALLTACSGGGGSSGKKSSGININNISYSGATGSAALTTTNQNEIATDSGKAVMALIDRADSEDISDLFLGLNRSAASESYEGDCGGTMQVSGSGDENNSNYSIRFNRYCTPVDEDELVMNGQISGTTRTSGSTITMRLDYDNLTLSLGEDSVGIDGYIDTRVVDSETNYQSTYSSRFNMTYNGETRLTAWDVTCNNSSCVREAYFVNDKKVYKTTNYRLYENSYGYQLRTALYTPEYGRVELTGTNIELCENGSDIASGTLEITDSNNKTMEVEYSGCGERTVTLDGNANLLSN